MIYSAWAIYRRRQGQYNKSVVMTQARELLSKTLESVVAFTAPDKILQDDHSFPDSKCGIGQRPAAV